MATTFSGNENESSSSSNCLNRQSIVKRLSLKSIIQNFMKSEETKAINQIEEELKLAKEKISEDGLDLDIVEIDLPPIKAKRREKVLEAIHNIFQAERVDDKLFIKVSIFVLQLYNFYFLIFVLFTQFNAGIKEEIHFALNVSLRQQLPGWWVQSDVVLVVNHNEFRSDIGGWNTRPTHHQRITPIINSSPPPLLWIEIIIILEMCDY
ncbi:24506_t:CDS:2 [Dentiscutata erythropus]|uniref:24506_t:CDS:1 n=1 Tax=Dentiscutata erythropus TaxID=1348616 RepID=A0A9N9JYK8_9GLOM|nr:24506_t:CDS:2 [Dentiscutata erythropus]